MLTVLVNVGYVFDLNQYVMEFKMKKNTVSFYVSIELLDNVMSPMRPTRYRAEADASLARPYNRLSVAFDPWCVHNMPS